MEELDELMEEVIKKVKFRDTVAAIAISTAFISFGILILILLDIIYISLEFRTAISILILILAWLSMLLGIYMLTSIPTPSLPLKIIADSQGILELLEKGYDGKIYVTMETFKKLPPKIGLKANMQVIDVSKEEAEEYAKFGDELSYAIAGAKKIRAKVVSKRKLKAGDVEVVTPEDIMKTLSSK